MTEFLSACYEYLGTIALLIAMPTIAAVYIIGAIKEKK